MTADSCRYNHHDQRYFLDVNYMGKINEMIRQERFEPINVTLGNMVNHSTVKFEAISGLTIITKPAGFLDSHKVSLSGN